MPYKQLLMMNNKTHSFWLILGAVGLGLLLWGGYKTLFQKTEIVPIGGTFTLVDTNGQKRHSKEFLGKVQVIYFGYTYCPDICPTALYSLTDALEELGEQANEIIPIFITIDPKRDTPELLKTYLTNFHSSIIGLTGTQAAIDDVKKKFKVYANKAPGSANDPDYLVDHTSLIYVMSPSGTYLSHMPHNMTPHAMAQHLKDVLRH